MSDSRLIELSCFDPGKQVRLTTYADTIITEPDGKNSILTAIRFGGYPEMVRAMADVIYGGADIEARQGDEKTRFLVCIPKGYRRQLGHDGVYATATLMANDDALTSDPQDGDEGNPDTEQQELQPRRCYIFCPSGDVNANLKL